MLDEATRQRIMIQQEGAILASVGSYSETSITIEIARCQIDGIANALIRMQGAEQTAAFVFALSDRVAGGVRDVTDCWSPAPVKVIEHDPVGPAKGFRITAHALDRFYYGLLCGMALMVMVTALGMGRM